MISVKILLIEHKNIDFHLYLGNVKSITMTTEPMEMIQLVRKMKMMIGSMMISLAVMGMIKQLPALKLLSRLISFSIIFLS